jgi:hypothetical protein
VSEILGATWSVLKSHAVEEISARDRRLTSAHVFDVSCLKQSVPQALSSKLSQTSTAIVATPTQLRITYAK